MRLPYALLGALVAATAAGHVTYARQGPLPATPILFVTQVPTPADFATIGSVFANHKGAVSDAPRGGDLWIRYPSGTLKNLTAAAGYGTTGLQGAGGIAVREPSVHWDGTKAVFSMVVGSPTRQYEVATYYWQLYEITGLGQNQTPVITKVPNQPANYNNVSPIYGADDRIIFSSDRPRDGQRHLYPQLDEYESTPVVTGLWSLDPATGDLFMLNHSPSGVFSPQVDSFGRVIFTRWDHLQRDQQADADAAGGGTYGTFNYASEAAGAAALNSRAEVFPEPRRAAGTVEAYTLNHFFPWQINDDGTGEETLNHIGRHELHRYFNRSFNDDSRLQEFNPGVTVQRQLDHELPADQGSAVAARHLHRHRRAGVHDARRRPDHQRERRADDQRRPDGHHLRHPSRDGQHRRHAERQPLRSLSQSAADGRRVAGGRAHERDAGGPERRHPGVSAVALQVPDEDHHARPASIGCPARC